MWQLAECLVLYAKAQPRPAAGISWATQASLRRILQREAEAEAVVAVLYGKEFQRIRCSGGTASERHHPRKPKRSLFFQQCFAQFMKRWSTWGQLQRERFVQASLQFGGTFLAFLMPTAELCTEPGGQGD